MTGPGTAHTKTYTRAKNIIKKNATMAFYDKKWQLYLETDVFGVSLQAGFLQARDGMQLPRNESPGNIVL